MSAPACGAPPTPATLQPTGHRERREVVLVEGEKCAAALIASGIAATTAMNGAKAPVDKTDWRPLAGKSVFIWPDRDAPGWDYAESAARACVAWRQRIRGHLVPPTDKPAKWDAADAVDDGLRLRGIHRPGTDGS